MVRDACADGGGVIADVLGEVVREVFFPVAGDVVLELRRAEAVVAAA